MPTAKPWRCEGWCENHMDSWDKKCLVKDCGKCTQCTEDSWTARTVLPWIGAVALFGVVLSLVLRRTICTRTEQVRNDSLTVPPTVHGISAPHTP
jgi:hypothetical protein